MHLHYIVRAVSFGSLAKRVGTTPSSQNETLQLQSDLLALDTANHLLWSVLRDNLVVVEHLELLSGITAHEVEDGLNATGVLLEPVAQVHDDTLDDDPEIALSVVLGNLLHAILSLGDLEVLGVGLGSFRGLDRGGGGSGGRGGSLLCKGRGS